MHKKFRAITATAKAQEKRLSRRFTVEAPEWIESNGHSFDAEQRIRSEFDNLHRNLNAAGKINNFFRTKLQEGSMTVRKKS